MGRAADERDARGRLAPRAAAGARELWLVNGPQFLARLTIQDDVVTLTSPRLALFLGWSYRDTHHGCFERGWTMTRAW